MNRVLIIAIIFFCSLQLNAQVEMSVFNSTGRGGVTTTFATDYQCLGINPANLGSIGFKMKAYKLAKFGDDEGGEHAVEKKFSFSMGLLEFGFSAYSDALKKKDLKETLFKAGTDSKLTKAEKFDAAIQFADAGFAVNFDMNWFGMAMQFNKVGGFAVNIREHIMGNIALNPLAADIMFNGYNSTYFDTVQIIQGDTTGVRFQPMLISEAFDGSSMQMLWYREYAFGYGRNIIKNDDLEINLGSAIKYLQGYGIVDVNVDKEEGKTRLFGAMSPIFGVNYGALIDNPGTGFKSIGKGLGYDFGVSALIKKKFKFGVAINDIGSMKWHTNVLTANNDTMNYISSTGFDSYNIFIEGEKLVGNESIFDWTYLPGGVTIKLPTTLRVGAGCYITDKLEVGLELVAPLNNYPGSYAKPILALGGDYNIFPWLRISTGIVNGGNYDFNLPLGITFQFGG
ncbi:MAG: hypothetical protein JKY33_01225, partial [Bacteroidia bacterium]|nr:hypothetical protein [Bacteroidia bacterium]